MGKSIKNTEGNGSEPTCEHKTCKIMTMLGNTTKTKVKIPMADIPKVPYNDRDYQKPLNGIYIYSPNNGKDPKLILSSSGRT